MNIAILVAGLPPERVGGTETQAARLASHLASRHQVTVFTRTSTVSADLASRPGCTVVQRCAVRRRGVRFAADFVQTLALIARSRRQIDVILAYQTVIDGLIGVVAKTLFGIPVIVSIRGDAEYRLDRYRQSRLLSPFVFRRADRLAVQTATLGDELVQAFERAGRSRAAEALRAKLIVVPNGISIPPPREGMGQGVLYVGRLIKSKGVDLLLDAMRDCPGERLTIVGDGPERRALEEHARGNPNVTFTGMVDTAEVDRYLAGAGVLVLPSLEEGLPNVVLEAMALGVPVIATRIGGIPDLIAHGETGWLIEPGKATTIADGIRRLMADAPLRARIASNGRAAVRPYEWPRAVETIESRLLELKSIGHP